MTTSSSVKHNNCPIGILDSGVGGLSIAKCITEQLPNESLIYVADSAHAPYGDISVSLIEQRVNFIADWLVKKQCKALVVACNTATVNVIDQLRARLSLPIIGVEPAIKPAALHSKTKKVGVLATQATSVNERFLSLVEQHKNGSQVFIQPCLGLVELIENGQRNSAHCKELLSNYLMPLKEHNVDTIVLGCTHYPYVGEVIRELVGSSVTIMETALPVTEQLQRQIKKYDLAAHSTINATHQFYSSLATTQSNDVFNTLWQSSIELKQLR